MTVFNNPEMEKLWANEHWWISTVKFEKGDPQYEQGDAETLPLPLKFFIPIHSVLDMSEAAGLYEQETLREIFEWHEDNMKGEWYLATGTINISDETNDVKDVLVAAWLNFALPSDAMLSRMRWMNMQSERHADLGGLSRAT
jgi:hypothetical protein